MHSIKVLFLFIIVIFTNSIYSQEITSVDQLFLTKNKNEASTTYLNIYLSSKDCYRCNGEIHKILSYIEKNNINVFINILSDNVLFAKKEMRPYDLSLAYFNESDVFNTYPRNFFYLKKDNIYYSDLNQVLKQIREFKKDLSHVNQNLPVDYEKLKSIEIKDSNLSVDNIHYAGSLKQNIFIYDPVLEIGAILDANKENLDYHEMTRVSEKIYNLSFDNSEIQEFLLIDYANASKFREKNKISEVKVTTVFVFEDRAYTQFLVTRSFKKNVNDKDLHLFTFPYLAIKELNNEEDILDLYDLETYDSYIEVEYLKYSNKTYRFGVGVYFPIIEILDKNKFITNIYTEGDYIGEAVFELSKDLKKINILNINPKEGMNFSYPSLKIGQQEYHFIKKMTDELSGEGIVLLKKNNVS